MTDGEAVFSYNTTSCYVCMHSCVSLTVCKCICERNRERQAIALYYVCVYVCLVDFHHYKHTLMQFVAVIIAMMAHNTQSNLGRKSDKHWLYKQQEKLSRHNKLRLGREYEFTFKWWCKSVNKAQSQNSDQNCEFCLFLLLSEIFL